MTVGEVLRKAREKRGLTQLQVAEKLGKTQPTVQAWESDKTLPRTDEVRDVAEVYGLRPEQLLPRRAS
jgi:transcriptional regulator with XRE-family HTH domain